MPGTEFGANLQWERERKGLTQKELARLVGVAPNTLALWERDEQVPRDPHQLVHLAQHLGTTVEALVGGAALRDSHAEAIRLGKRDVIKQLRGFVEELEQDDGQVSPEQLAVDRARRDAKRLAQQTTGPAKDRPA